MSEHDLGGITPERLARLSQDQRDIVEARMAKARERAKIIYKINDPDPEVRQQVLDALRDSDDDRCEHERSIWKHCLNCGEIDHLLFPEIFDKDGFRLDEGNE